MGLGVSSTATLILAVGFIAVAAGLAMLALQVKRLRASSLEQRRRSADRATDPSPPDRCAEDAIGGQVDGFEVTELLFSNRHTSIFRLASSTNDGLPKAIIGKVYHCDAARELARKEFEALQHITSAPIPIRLSHSPTQPEEPMLIMEHIEGVRFDRLELTHFRVDTGSEAKEAQLHSTAISNGPPNELADIWQAAARALVSVHQAGWVHGDIAPRNLILTSKRTQEPTSAYPVRVIDFGATQCVNEQREDDQLGSDHRDDDKREDVSSNAERSSGANDAEPRRVVGTPTCMSPEVASGERATMASDVYSLGCVFFELATGRPLFSGSTSIEICWKQANSAPDLPALEHFQRIGLTATHHNILTQMLQKIPSDRPSITEIADRLASI